MGIFNLRFRMFQFRIELVNLVGKLCFLLAIDPGVTTFRSIFGLLSIELIA